MNLVGSDYKGKMEIIIVSDGSTDQTRGIVTATAEKTNKTNVKIKFYEYFPSRGKAYALNLGISKAKGEIIIFADARQFFEENAIKQLVQNFSLKEIGGVSGELLFYKDSSSMIKTEMGLYWNYEKFIRKLESTTGSVVGATGAIYAIKKSLYKKIPEDIILDDVLIPLNIAKQGYRVIFDAGAKAYDILPDTFSGEKKRKVRTLLGNWQLISYYPELVIPFMHPMWFRLISHKFLRLAVPFAGIYSLIYPFFTKNLFIKIFSILCIAIGASSMHQYKQKIINRLFSPIRAIVQLNYFAIIAFYYFCINKKDVWKER